LREKLIAKKAPQKIITVDGDKFLVVGLSRLARSKLLAAMRTDAGDLSNDKIERQFLSACVFDPDTNQPVFSENENSLWDDVPAAIVAPLVVAVRDVNYLDDDDVKKN
jgi:hypothetical protein